MELGWTELLAVLTVLFGGGGGVAWFKTWQDKRTARLTADATVQVAQIESDSSERIHMVDVLMERMKIVEVGAEKLRAHNLAQDKELADLRRSYAQALSKIDILDSALLVERRLRRSAQAERDTAVADAEFFKGQLQGGLSEVSERLDTFDAAEPSDD